MITKICSKCKKEKPLSEFYKDRNGRSKYGCRPDCKQCNKQTQFQYKQKNRRKTNRQRSEIRATWSADKKKEEGLKTNYGLTLKQHKEMYIKQNGCCAICKQNLSYDRAMTDHNHKTDKVRGLLCQACNIGLGYIERDGFIKNALKYLEIFK